MSLNLKILAAMKFLILFQILGGCLAFACDKTELAAIACDTSTYFIYGAVGISNGTLNDNFDLKTFLGLLGFNNTSRRLPIIVNTKNNFMSSAEYVRCDGEDHQLDINTRMGLTPENAPITGILYVCGLLEAEKMRFIFHNNASWSQNDQQRHCLTFQGVPTKFLGKMNRCLEDYKVYREKCLRVEPKDKFEAFDKKFCGVLFLMTAFFVVFVAYKYFKVNAISNIQ